MSQSQQSLNLNLPEMNLSENFFDNFEEISKKYENINIKIDNVKEYENIIKNDTFNDINNIKFHNNNIYDHSNTLILFNFMNFLFCKGRNSIHAYKK